MIHFSSHLYLLVGEVQYMSVCSSQYSVYLNLLTRIVGLVIFLNFYTLLLWLTLGHLLLDCVCGFCGFFYASKVLCLL